jgi:multidrug efflux pump subunit AcrA (membrane-fusion protein)
VATAILAAFAIVTAWYARRAFLEQSQEVRAIEQQVTDALELASQQAKLLEVQSGQLELQRQQLDDQRQANAKQAGVLELQASELRESLDERKRDAHERNRAQAAQVTAWFALTSGKTWAAQIRNASELPILDVRTFFHYVAEKWQGGDWDSRMLGGPVERIRVLPPQQDRFVAIPENVWSQMTDVSDNNYVVSIEFTDAAGNRWERDPRRALTARS